MKPTHVVQQTYEWASIADIIIYAIQPQQLAASRSTELPPTAVVPFPYVLFKQCNKSWGSDIIVRRCCRPNLTLPASPYASPSLGAQETTTVCAVGCLMSSTSMAIRSKSIPVPTNVSGSFVPANPGTVNTWLRDNNGCVRVWPRCTRSRAAAVSTQTVERNRRLTKRPGVRVGAGPGTQ